MNHPKTWLILLFMMCTVSVHASDLAKEKRWADQVVDAILDGEAVWLNDGSTDFLSIYTEADNDKAQALIVMHGTGVHPDWQQVVQPLRVNLIEYDWHTLSIQMPVLANEAEHDAYAPLYDEVTPRINAAIDYLKKADVKRIVLVAHSQGASMSAYHLSKTSANVDGFVAIGLPGKAKDSRMNSLITLEEFDVPMLDLYGTEDLESVLDSTAQRQAAAKKVNKNYQQMQIEGNHFFDDNDEALTEAVANRLEALK